MRSTAAKISEHMAAITISAMMIPRQLRSSGPGAINSCRASNTKHLERVEDSLKN